MEKEAIEKLSLENHFRYERKFILEADCRQHALFFIKNHPAFFKEIFHSRVVNNIYLDTPKLQFYFANKSGVSERKKLRIRWYGETFGAIQRPKLEYKIKSGLLGDKWSFSLCDFNFDKGFEVRSLPEMLRRSELPSPVREDIQNLSPTLLNSYLRTYFLSADGDFRLTLDEQLAYYRIDNYSNGFLFKIFDATKWIVELKYAPENDHRASEISKAFPYRMNKNSKYVNGLDFLNGRKQCDFV